MTSAAKKERKKAETDVVADLIRKHRPEVGYPRRAALKLVKYARALHKHYEDDCNRERTEHEKRDEALLESSVRAVCAAIKVGVKFNGDPRGFPVKLQFGPDALTQPYNTWGGAEDGYGIGESESE